ncbi:MAG: Cna B-type domain-containing protein [Lachnospiraceae bacterium]|nr:Cna B-type domain-containing protein [Lachnospiraceae bacterium]
MKKSRKKIIVAILLVTMLSQTLYSAASSVFGLNAQSYAYADDEFTEAVEPGEDVDESTQDDAEIVQEAPDTEETEEQTVDEETRVAPSEDVSEPDEAPASDDGFVDEEADDTPIDEEAAYDIEEEESEAVSEIRLRASYVDSETGSAVKDTEDLDIESNYLYIIEYEAPEITDYTYSKTTINIEGNEYDITAILTEDVNGTEAYSITTDKNIADKDVNDASWTRLVKDAVIVMNYDEANEETVEAISEEKAFSENEAVSDDETVSDNEAVSENEASEDEAEKRVYEYEDNKVKVTAKLEKADAIPDDAYFAVTPLSDAEADAYIEALNADLGEDQSRITKDNILLYDIAFYTDESKSEEIEPEEGTVSVSIEFKRNQISEELGIENNEDVQVTHFEESSGTIDPVTIDAQTSADSKTVEFEVESFSVYGLWGDPFENVKAGKTVSYSDALGDAVNYGVVANVMHLDGHMETNFAVGTMQNSAQIQSCKNNGGGAGRTFIGAYDNGGSKTFLMDKNANAGSLYIYTTEDVLDKMDPAMKSRSGVIVDTHSYTEQQIKDKVSSMVDTVKRISDELMKEENCYQYASLLKNGYVDFTGKPAGTYYISFDASENSNNKFPVSNYEIRINSDQNVVLNIPDTDVSFGQYRLYIDGEQKVPQGNSDEEILFEKLIFNCPNAKTARTSTAVTGTFLVPNADFYNDNVAAGFLVANNIRKIGGQEWHCISKDIEIVEDDKTSLDLEVTKLLKDSSENVVEDDVWPDDGFTFKISKYPCNDPDDANDGNVIKNINDIPDIPGMSNGEKFVTIFKDTPGHKATFGTLEFEGKSVYEDSRAHVSGSYNDTKYLCFMYKVTETAGSASGIEYDAEPYYIKVFVNSQRVVENNVTRYYVWTETKVNRTVTEYSCWPGMPEFVNHVSKPEYGTIKVSKEVLRDGAAVPYDENDNTYYKVKIFGSGNSTGAYTWVDYSKAKVTSDKGRNVPRSYGEETTGNGNKGNVMYFDIKAGETVTISDLPVTKGSADASYWVEEYFSEDDVKPDDVDYEDFNGFSGKNTYDGGILNGGVTNTTTKPGDFNNGEHKASVTIVNKYNYPKATIEVTKELSGLRTGEAWPDGGFAFTLEAVDPSDAPMPGNKTVNASQNNPKASWDTIEFANKTANYWYKITEDTSKATKEVSINSKTYKEDANGYLYDPEPYMVKVHVEQGIEPTATVTYHYGNDQAAGASSATYTNLKKHPASYTPKATKAIENLSGDETVTLTFDLYEGDGTSPIDSVTDTWGNGDNHEISFKPISYTEKREHHYRIVERDSLGATATPSNADVIAEISFDVSVDYDANGNLVATAKDSSGNTLSEGSSVGTIKNVYPTDDRPFVSVRKILENRKMASNDGFQIKVTDKAGNLVSGLKKSVNNQLVDLANPVDIPAIAGANESDITIYLPSYTYAQARAKKTDVYHFEEIHKSETINGVTYSSAEYDVTVESDIVGGKIVFTVSGADDVSFNNTYGASGNAVIKGRKNLEGAKLSEGEFTFKLEGEGITAQTVTNKADGTFEFAPIEYTLDMLGGANTKDFTYTVTEVKPDEPNEGMVYDETPYTVIVTVTDNGNGNLVTEVKDNGLFSKGFTNTYSETGEISFRIAKSMTNWPKGKTFTFDLYDGDKDKGTHLKTFTVSEGDYDSTTEMYYSEAFEITAPKIVDGAVNPHTYTFVEQVKDNDGVTYDDHPIKTYTIDWRSDNNGHVLAYHDDKVANPTLDHVVSIGFKNSYDATGEFAPKVEKILSGSEERLDDFRFELKGADGKRIGDIVTLIKDDEDGIADLPKISYELSDLNAKNDKGYKTGTYVYKVAEIAPDGAVKSADGKTAKLNGITYDISDHEITVTVTDNGHGGLDVTASGTGVTSEGTVTITNVYDSKGGVVLQAKKQVLDGEGDDAKEVKDGIKLDGTFDFNLKDSSGKVLGTKTTDASGVVTFDEISYTREQAGETYTYVIEETNKNTDGRPYSKAKDNVPQTVTVEVKDNKDGTITATPSYRVKDDNDNVTDNLPVFKNIISGEDKISLDVSKNLDNEIGVDKTFTFELKEGDTVKQSKAITYKKGEKGDKSVSFDDISYSIKDLEGKTSRTYYYQVSEKAGNDGVTYDTTTYAVKVTISIDERGRFEAKKEVKKYSSGKDDWWTSLMNNVASVFNGGDNDAIEFKNTYAPKGEVTFEGKKSFSVKDTGLSLEGFEFVIKEGNTTVAEGTSKADGTVTYNKIEYTAAGHHEYTVSEKKKDGFTENKTIGSFTVDVTDNGSGNLVVTPSENYGKQLEFVNTPVELKISKLDVTDEKELAGAKFTLSGEKLEAPVTWTSDGNVKTIYGLKAGNYTLTEDKAPVGYEETQSVSFYLSDKGEVRMNESFIKKLLGNGRDDVEAAEGTLIIRDAVKPITITKMDAGYENTLPGAEFDIVNADGSAITPEQGSIGQKDGVYVLTNLKAGDYKLVETKAPFGYALAEPILFTLSLDRLVTIAAGSKAKAIGTELADGKKYTSEIQVPDTPIDVFVTKEAPADDGQGTKTLGGAKLEIQKYNSETEKWETAVSEFDSASEGRVTRISDLTPGEYRLVENSAPADYLIAKPVPFTINADGTITGSNVTRDAKTGMYYISMTDIPIGTTTFKGHKKWVDGTGENRPSITVELQRCYADEKANEEAWETVAGPIAVTSPAYSFAFSKTNDDKELYKADQHGKEYAYRFKETMGESSVTYVAENDGVIEISDQETDYELKNTVSGDVTINVTKNWNVGKVINDDIYKHFTATLQRTANGTTEVLEKDFTVDKDFGTRSFGPYDKYDENGFEYTYEIIETKGEGNLYSWTGSKTVDSGKAGTASTLDLKLINTHTDVPTIPVVIEANKEVKSSTGVDQPKDGFEFGLYVKDTDEESGYRLIESKTTGTDGKVTFEEISYDENQVGEHVYYIHEIEPANRKAGFEAYDSGYYPVYVTVGYNADHTGLTRSIGYGEKKAQDLTITNKYNAKGSVKLSLSKEVVYTKADGTEVAYWPEGETFTFEVYDNGSYLEGKDVTFSSTDAVEFVSPEYTAEGSHTYSFVEKKDESKSGIGYDASIEPVSVSFKDDGEGHLKPYKGEGAQAELIEGSLTLDTFKNHYDANGSIELSGIKIFEQGEIEDGMFSVSISKNGAALDNVPITKNVNSGNWSYSEHFTLADLDPDTHTAEYTYEVKEDLTNKISGVIYDESVYTVKVTVADTKRNGELDITKTVLKDGEPTEANDTKTLNFINTKPGGEKATIRISKSLPGAEHTERLNDKFEFILSDDEEIERQGYDAKIQGAEFTVSFTPEEVGTSESPRTFTYTVIETPPTGDDVTEIELGGVTYKYKDGFLYDPEPRSVSVNVWYNPDSKKLETKVIYPDPKNQYVEITNPYITEGEAKITVGKQLVDYDDPTKLMDDYYPEGGFSFRLYDPETDTYSSVKTITKNCRTVEFTAEDAPFLKYTNRALKFGAVNEASTYIKDARYYYLEELPNTYGDAFINDPEGSALVKVTLDEADGVINTTVETRKTNDEAIDKTTDLRSLFEKLTGSDDKEDADVWFTNKVQKSGKLALSGNKSLAYLDGNGLSDDAFAEAAKTFEDLRFDVRVRSSRLGYDKTVTGTVASDGKISFDEGFDFRETGTYDVSISERWANGQAPEGAAYDLKWDKPATFKIDVTDEDKNGILEVSSPYDRNENAAGVADATGADGEFAISFTCTNQLNLKWKIDKIFLGVGENETLTAHLQLLDGNKVVDEWDATATGQNAGEDGRAVLRHELTTDKVKLGKTYTLHETAQPEGYVLADDIKVFFDKDGTYVLDDDGVSRPVGNPIEMLNAKPDLKHTYVEITKTWEDPYDETPEKRPTVYAQVYRKVKGSNDAYKPYGDEPVIIARQADGTYKAVVENLPANAYIKNAYIDYEYKAEEVVTNELKLAGYELVSGSNNAYIGSTLTTTEKSGNTVRLHNKMEQRYIDIPVRKVWRDGKSVATHPMITFHLLADGKDTGKTVNLPSGQLEGKFKDLEVYDFSAANKHEIVYTVTEDPVPGYKKSEGIKNADGSWTFINDSVKADIIKYDANDESARPAELTGAEFVIEKTDGSWKANFKSGQNLEFAIGSKSGGITPGEYTMREIKAPEGYALSAQVAHFTVGEDGKVTQTDKWVKSNWRKDGICFEDKPLYGAFRIIKVDGDTEAPLEGAEFKLYSDKAYNSGSRVLSNYIAGEDVIYELDTYRSDANGRIEIDDLAWGTYYLEEITAPAGYEVPENNVFIFDVDGTHNTPDSDDYLELHYIANYEEHRDSSSSSSSSSTTSSSSTSTTSSSSSETTSSSSTPDTPRTPDTGSSTTSSSSSSRYLSGVLGSRKGGFVSDVLGARKAPTSGVLGERFSPVTGDDLTLNFWIMVLCAAGLIGMSFVYSDDDEEEGEEGKKKKVRKFRLRRAKAKK